jgi:hypothetical protein
LIDQSITLLSLVSYQPGSSRAVMVMDNFLPLHSQYF